MDKRDHGAVYFGLMEIHISSRHLKLTGAIRAFVTEKVSTLEHIADNIIGVHVVLLHDETKAAAKAICVKAHLAVPGPDIHAVDYDSDLYAAIDKLAAKLARQLRKRKTKLVDKRKQIGRRQAESRRAGKTLV